MWREALSTHVDEIVRTLEWEGPIERIEWDAGPYAYPVIPPAFVEERFEGPVTVMATNGRVHVVHGRWEVVIRGIDARGEHEVLARWELVRAQDASVAGETVAIHTTDGVQGSAHLVGASERRWLGASERRLGGASERWRIGASERRLGGASERALAGASERRLGGASERHLGGASERALGGGSGWPGWGR